MVGGVKGCTEKCACCTGCWAEGKNSSIQIIRYHNSRRPLSHSRYIAVIYTFAIEGLLTICGEKPVVYSSKHTFGIDALISK